MRHAQIDCLLFGGVLITVWMRMHDNHCIRYVIRVGGGCGLVCLSEEGVARYHAYRRVTQPPIRMIVLWQVYGHFPLWTFPTILKCPTILWQCLLPSPKQRRPASIHCPEIQVPTHVATEWIVFPMLSSSKQSRQSLEYMHVFRRKILKFNRVTMCALWRGLDFSLPSLSKSMPV